MEFHQTSVAEIETNNRAPTRNSTGATHERTGPSAISATMPPVPILHRDGSFGEHEPEGDANDQPFAPIVQPYPIPASPPQTAEQRAHLVEVFREELAEELVDYGRRGRRAYQRPITAHDLRDSQVTEALSNNGCLNGMPYLLAENIIRHDWHKITGDCIYTVRMHGGPPRANATELEANYAGVPYTIWEYWGQRTRVREAHVTRYVHAFGVDGFHRAVMWFWMNEEEWLELWRQRQASRQG